MTQFPMTNDQSNPNDPIPKKYDLGKRTTKFSKDIIDFCKSISNNQILNPLINQLIRSATSIGANYCEADEASSKKDFINKICIAIKETKETKYWLNLIAHAKAESAPPARILWQEAQELNLIFAKIIRTSRNKDN